jgi:hypothetical protein
MAYNPNQGYPNQGYPNQGYNPGYQQVPSGGSGDYGEQYVPNSLDGQQQMGGNNPFNDPGHTNYLREESRSAHCQVIVATCFLIGGIVLAIILKASGSIGLGAMIAIIVASYLLYLCIGCCCNSTRDYLSNIDKGENFHRYCEMLRTSQGAFEFGVTCYHYEMRMHHTSHGYETRQEKVITHTANEVLTPTFCKDESGPMDRVQAQTNMIFVEYLAKFKFLDPQSQMRFDQFQQNFRARNTRDTHQDFTMVFKINGMVDKRTYYVGELEHDYYCCFNGCGFIGCLLPYSCWMENKVSRFNAEIIKSVQL